MRRLFGFLNDSSKGGRASARRPRDDQDSYSSYDDSRSYYSNSDYDSESGSYYSSQASHSYETGDGESSLVSLESTTSVGSIQYLFQKVNRSYNAVRSRSLNLNAFKKIPSPTRVKSSDETIIARNDSSSVQVVPEEEAVNHGIEHDFDQHVNYDEFGDASYEHDLRAGDHVIRWKMLGYLYPIQIHGIVLSAGPDIVTLVDFGLTSVKCYDKVGGLDDEAGNKVHKYNKTRRRMNVITLADGKEIRKWTKVGYGDEVEIKVHDKIVKEGKDADDCRTANNSKPPGVEVELKSSSSSWLCSSNRQITDGKSAKKSVLKLPSSDPSKLVLARLRFLLENGEEAFPPPTKDQLEEKNNLPTLLPPHHLLYANSECIAVWVKTGHWSTLQGSVFLHSSTVGNVKQTATLAMYLGAQTATVPASGLWGWLGGTTTVSLFAAQPWVVPALIGGGMVYIGLPTMFLWKAKGKWSDTETKLNEAFWSWVDNDTIVALVQNWKCFSDGVV